MGDITFRAVEVLRSVPYIACEDTRTTARLLSRLQIKGQKLISLFEHNESRRVGRLLALLKGGADIALVSEAGTPTISDPGFRLVTRCVEEGVFVVPIPGPCAALAALSVSGLPMDKFLFLGFPPKKGAKLGRFLSRATQPQLTSVVYLPARRLESFLALLDERAPAARMVVAREMTKVYEEFIRGSPHELLELLRERPVKGECTLVIYVPVEAPDSR